MERLEQAAVLFSAVVSLFLSHLMPTLPSAALPVSRLPLVALLRELGAGLLPGVYLSSCILIYVLAFSEVTVSKEHLISSAPLPEAGGQEQGGKGLQRGGFAPCCEEKMGEGVRVVSPSVFTVLRELEAGPLDPAASLPAGFPHLHTPCDATQLVTAFPRSVAA